MNASRVTRHLLIAGRVQGVGFRMHMERAARAHGITGWVRNRCDGTVEAVVQGSAAAVEAIVAAARQGPRAARVTDVCVTEAEGEFAAFETRPTE